MTAEQIISAGRASFAHLWYPEGVTQSPSQRDSEPHHPTSKTAGSAHLRLQALAEALRERRASSGLSIRGAAREAGVSFMTLSRVESGTQPDLVTFLRLCAWLHERPETFLGSATPREAETPEVVAKHLFTDPRLERDAASQIAAVVRDMYAALASPPPDRETLACHLRAAGTLRPGVSERLAGLLGDMQAQLRQLESEGRM